MKFNDKKSKDFLNAIFNLFLAYTMILTQSWVADGIEGQELFPWWTGGIKAGSGSFIWVVEAGLLIVSVVCAVWLYERRRTFLPLQVQRIGEPGKVAPHRVLVLSISLTSWKWSPDKLEQKDRTVDLPDTLESALTVMSALGGREKFTWEQMLRAVAAHRERLELIILVGSKGEHGTAKSFDACRDMILHYFPNLPETAIEKREADFESLDDLIGKYRQIIHGESRRKNEIMIDVTSGTKVVSIAAAMVTLEHPEIEFEYIETDGNKRVRSFNITSKSNAGD